MEEVFKKRKKFNTAGLCIPQYHYMADVSSKVKRIIEEYIGQEEYFTINRARQYGKTTILYLLQEKLKEYCVVVSLSFEGREEYFVSLQNFAQGLNISFYKSLKKSNQKLSEIFQEPIRHPLAMEEISERMTDLCEQARKPVILMIDEVDKAADNEVFLTFLGILRERYLKRKVGGDAAFHSVILAGVHDIKNLKRKIHSDMDAGFNSPWNISAFFEIDMSLSVSEIESMLREYENDVHTGMDIEKMACQLHDYTDGYPFLVSCLCRIMDEKGLAWDKRGFQTAVKELLKTNNTLFDDVIKNIQNHPQFSELAEQIILQGARVAFEIRNPVIQQGVMYGILKEQDGRTAVSNILFETLIINYFVSVRSAYALTSSGYVEQGQYIHNGILDMELIMCRFSAFLKAEYRDEDGKFIENHGRLLFLSFLRPIINGSGHYAVEPQTRKNNRIDIQVFYGNQEFIVELKVWRGEKYEQSGYDQLVRYLEARDVKKGYMLSFCDNKQAPRQNQTFRYRGHEICEVIEAYRDK